MDTHILNQTIRRLALTEPNRSPVLSCFFDLTLPRQNHIEDLKAWAEVAAPTMKGRSRQDFEDALEETIRWLKEEKRPNAKGVAIFCRWGDEPFLIPLQFHSPLPNGFHVDSLPQVYPLVEVMDSYDRFVIVITTEQKARIMELCIGSVTKSIFAERPEIRERIGREWTKEHYQNHKRERSERFLKEKIQIIDGIVTRGQHDHIILAGQSALVTRLYRSLPKRLQEKVISTFSTASDRHEHQLIEDALKLFIEHEQDISQRNVQRLEAAIKTGGLGVVGFDAAKRALEIGQAEMLLIDQEFNIAEAQEELTRLAILSGVEIETVSDCDLLKSYGGVGCLLRYSYPDTPKEAKVA